MRRALLLIAILALVPAAAWAAAGHKADLTMVIDFGYIFEQFGAMMNMEGMEGTEGMPGAAPEMPSEMEMTGRIFWTEKFMRLDLDPFEGTHESTILDIDNQVTYKLDHVNKQAMRLELEDFDEEMITGMDMPDPESMASDWQGFLDAMSAIDGAVINELAPRTISGYECKGFSFDVDMSKMMESPDEEADAEEGEEMAAMMGAMMSAMGGYTGEIWVAENISMPISMTLNTMMMNYTWELSSIEKGDIPVSRFEVPADYEVVDMDLPDMSEMPDHPNMPAPQPESSAR